MSPNKESLLCSIKQLHTCHNVILHTRTTLITTALFLKIYYHKEFQDPTIRLSFCDYQFRRHHVGTSSNSMKLESINLVMYLVTISWIKRYSQERRIVKLMDVHDNFISLSLLIKYAI
jgi:hypothetical protein